MLNQLNEHLQIVKKTIEDNESKIIEVAKRITENFYSGPKVMFCGNGGSAADSQHLAAEFIGRFQRERQALPALSLTTDTSILTCIGNDYGFDKIFTRQLEALGCYDDILIGISTSGNSKNVVDAFKYSKDNYIFTVSFTGNDGGELAKISDININVDSKVTARVQETHIFIGHLICELVEEAIVNGKSKSNS